MAHSNKAEVGGDFIGSFIGPVRDITVYKNAVDDSSKLGDDIKQTLKKAREVIENAELSENNKVDVIDELNKFTDELNKPKQDDARMKRCAERIEKLAPTVSSILASITSLAKFFGPD